MVFLISLALALILVFALGKTLRKHPAPFYLAAVVLSAAVVLCTFLQVRFTGVVNTYLWPVFARGAMAGSLFVLVMVAGAFPNGSKGARLLMPIRGQLSILACILTIGHNIAYGKTYFVMLFTRPSRMPVTTLLAAFCSIGMILIMLPLFVTSFSCVRRKMNARSWKRLQRLAYGFYALLIAHILLLTIPYAIQGRAGYRLTVFVYSAVFVSYAICRLLKAAAIRHKTQKSLPKKQVAGVLCGVLAAGLMLCGVYGKAAVNEKAAALEAAAVQASAVPTETAIPAETTAPVETAVPIETSAPEETTTPEETASPAETPVPIETAAPVEQTTPAETSAPVETAAVTPTPTPAPTPEIVSVYKDGTYSGSGMGNHGTNSDVVVSVTIEQDRIVSIVITGFQDDREYFDPAIEGAGMISAMLSAQSANVDTVSGATYSSEGLIDAVRAALKSARN